MAKVLILEFDGVGDEGYRAVNTALGIDVDDPGANWPAGIVSHMAGASPTGWVVVEVWDSEDSAAKFMESRLGAALKSADMPMPTRQAWIELAADTRVG